MGRRPKKNRSLDHGNFGRKESASRPTDRGSVPGEIRFRQGIVPGEASRVHDFNAALAVCGFLLLAVALVFGQTLRHEFVGYDDNGYVYENPQVIGGLTVDGIAWAFTTYHASNWHPLTWLSHMVDCQLYGLGAGGHHLTNVLLHAAAAILLFLVLRRMTGDLWPSAWVAAVFAIHPLRAESVAWVAERKDVLSGLFFMLTLGAYVGYVRRPFSLVRYLSVAVLLILGLMSKPMLVTLPFVLLLLDYWPLGRMTPSTAHRGWGGSCTAVHRSWGGSCTAAPGATGQLSPQRITASTLWRLIVEKVPLFVLAAASCVVTPLAQGQAVLTLEVAPISARISNAIISYVAYLGQFFYPAGLAAFYRHSGDSLPGWKVVGAVSLLASISAGAVVWRRRFPYLFVGWFWYVGMLVPVIGLVQTGLQAMADRYTYLPQIGLCIALAWGAAGVFATWPAGRWACGVGSALVVLVLMGGAWRQTSYWHDNETLWNRALACTAPSATAYNNLGMTLTKRGQADEAMSYYRKALEVDASSIESHNNLGVLLANRGQSDEAIAHYQTALKLKPDYAEAHQNLGVELARRGQTDAAIEHFRKSLDIKPDSAGALSHLGLALASQGQYEAAIVEYRKSLRIDPKSHETHNNLGVALAASGQVDAAIACYQESLEIKSDQADTHYNLGVALARRGRVDAAIADYQKALENKPDYVEAHNNLGNALARCGQFDAAITHYQQALKIKPDYPDAHTNLRAARDEQRKVFEVVAQWRETLRRQPDQVAVVNQLAWVLATCPDASVRSGAEAVELAQRADKLSKGREPAVLGTLAAAYAETGQFSEAVATAQRAAALADAAGNATLADALRRRIQLYRAGSPYRDIPPAHRQ